MSKLKSWNGAGLADGVNAGTNAGTGDDAFSGFLDTPNYNAALGAIGLSNSTENDRVWWSFTAVSTWVVDFEVYVDTAGVGPSSAKPFFRLDSGGGATPMMHFGINTGGLISVRNNANGSLQQSAASLTAATWYRVVAFGSTASSTVSVWIGAPGVDPATSTNVLTGTNGYYAANIGVTTQPNYAIWGRFDSSQFGTIMRFRRLYLGNTAADAGTFPWPPGAPTALGHGTATSSTMPLSWTAPTNVPNLAVASYKVYKDGVAVSGAAPTGTSYTVTGLAAATSYSWQVSAVDTGGNEGPKSSAHAASTASGGDVTAPTVPTGLTHTARTDHSITLDWSDSTDAVGVTGYTVYRNGSAVGAPSASTFTDTGLAASTSYSYTVTAHDAIPNTSAPSSAYVVSTLADNDRSWAGAGLANGATIVEGVTVGTGDDPFDDVTGAPTFDLDAGAVRILNGATIRGLTWNAFGFVTSWAAQVYVQFVAPPTATSALLYLSSTANGRLGGVYTGSAGVLTLRDKDQGLKSTSPAIVGGTVYRLNLWGDSTGKVDVEMGAYGSPDVTWSATANLGIADMPDAITFGRQSGTAYGTDVLLGHLRVAERTTKFGPYETVTAPVSSSVRKWDGPLTDDATVDPTTVGTGDYAFAEFGTTAASYSAATGRITIPNVAGMAYVVWTGLTQSAGWAYRVRIRWEDNPSGLAYVVKALNASNGRLWGITTNSARQLALRNAGGTAVQTAGTGLAADTDYDVFMYGTVGSALVKVTVRTSDGDVVWDPPATSITSTTAPAKMYFGRDSGTQYGAVLYLSHFASSETAAEIPLPETLLPVRWYLEPAGGGTLVPLRLLGLEPPGGGTIVELNTIPTRETYTPAPDSVDAFLYPFAPESVWKHSVTDQTQYELATDPITAKLLGGTAGVTANYANWTYPFFKASLDDDLIEVRQVEYVSSPGGAGIGWVIDHVVQSHGYHRIPYAAQWAGTTNTDRPVCVLEADGVTTLEMYKFGWYRKADNSYAGNLTPAEREALGPSALFVAIRYTPVSNDIRSWGLSAGRQASGVSQFGGMVRKHEVAGEEIRHLIKGAIPPSYLALPTSTSQGTIIRSGNNPPPATALCVWPSRQSDAQQGGNVYTGLIPMGTVFAIPQDVDIDAYGAAHGFTAGDMRLARALQNYGYCPLVASSTITFFVEPGSSSAVASRWASTTFPLLRTLLRRVKNNLAGPAGTEGYQAVDNVLVPFDDSYIMGGGTRVDPIQPPLTQGTIGI
jgi:chitodextrinase